MPSSSLFYTLSLHDALPIYVLDNGVRALAVLDHFFQVILQQGCQFVYFSSNLTIHGDRLEYFVQLVRQLRRERGKIIDEVERVDRKSTRLNSKSPDHLVCRLPPCSTLFPYTTLFRSMFLTMESARLPCWTTFSRLSFSKVVNSSTSPRTLPSMATGLSTSFSSSVSSAESAEKLLTKLSG